jgi:hypothetical protein
MVEEYGLRMMTEPEIRALGWEWIIMAVADLTNVDGFDEEGDKRVSRHMFDKR